MSTPEFHEGDGAWCCDARLPARPQNSATYRNTPAPAGERTPGPWVGRRRCGPAFAR